MRIGSKGNPSPLTAVEYSKPSRRRTSAWLCCLRSCMPCVWRNAGVAQHVPSAQTLERVAVILQARVRGKMARKLIRVRTVAPGVIHASIRGDRAFLRRIGIDDVGQNGVPRSIDYLALDTSVYCSRVAIPNHDTTTNVTALSGAQLAQHIGAQRRTFAYINGTFFNAGQRASADHASNAPIGDVTVPGVKIDCIPIPQTYRQDFESRRFDDNSSLMCGPVLSQEGKAMFDEDTAKHDRFHQRGLPDVPGMLRHANDPHARAALGTPLHGDLRSGNRVRLMVALSGSRVRTVDGFTLLEWARVTARLDRMNPGPTWSLNLDGGRSVSMGVVDRQGRKVVAISELQDGRPLSNLIVFQERDE